MSITITNLYKIFDKRPAIDRVSMELDPGIIYGLFGRNGAGKTTLLNLIANRLKADSGMMLIDGQPLSENGPGLARIYLADSSWPYSSWGRVGQAFHTAEALYGGFDGELAEQMLKDFGLSTERRFSSLSQGQRQEVKATLALCLPVDYVLFDEITSGVDAAGRELIYRYILRTYEQRERTYLLSTHIMNEIEPLLARAYIIDHGSMVQSFDLEDLPHLGFSLLGKPEQVELFIKSNGRRVLSRTSLGQLVQVGVSGPMPEELPAGLLAQPLDLQSYFVATTEGEQL
ncbi:ABC transporter ATP-binding protein [Bombiscardovia nodaiensis]|uniref:ABC transporter ATP-binding protein n=1 Tax=Bombiscardovia nodaiensis TaxID=2932181 RepID=A0ABN6SC43_9BIFI|nr:ABC transporter ATP-binding protein [Bombiscardovia nodaiensis]